MKNKINFSIKEWLSMACPAGNKQPEGSKTKEELTSILGLEGCGEGTINYRINALIQAGFLKKVKVGRYTYFFLKTPGEK